jgi:hypothetical protein
MADGIRDLEAYRRAQLDREMTHGPAPYDPWPDAYKSVNRGAEWVAEQLPKMDTGERYMDDTGRIINPDYENLEKATNVMGMAIDPFAKGSAGVAGMLGGASSRLAVPRAFEQAKQLREAGFSPQQIWAKTRMDQPMIVNPLDPELKFEFSDQGARLKNMGFMDYLKSKLPNQPQATLKDVLEHPTLFEHYPDLANLPVKRNFQLFDPYARGYYAKSWGNNPEHMAINYRPNGDMLQTTLHEGQHWVQNREGFSPGISPDRVKATAFEKLRDKQNTLDFLKDTAHNLDKGADPDELFHDGDMYALLPREEIDRRIAQNKDHLDRWTRIYNNPHKFYEATLGETEARYFPDRGMKYSEEAIRLMNPTVGKRGRYELSDLTNAEDPNTWLKSTLHDRLPVGKIPTDEAPSGFSTAMDKVNRAIPWMFGAGEAAQLRGSTPQGEVQDNPLGDMRIHNSGIAPLLQR